MASQLNFVVSGIVEAFMNKVAQWTVFVWMIAQSKWSLLVIDLGQSFIRGWFRIPGTLLAIPINCVFWIDEWALLSQELLLFLWIDDWPVQLIEKLLIRGLFVGAPALYYAEFWRISRSDGMWLVARFGWSLWFLQSPDGSNCISQGPVIELQVPDASLVESLGARQKIPK